MLFKLKLIDWWVNINDALCRNIKKVPSAHSDMKADAFLSCVLLCSFSSCGTLNSKFYWVDRSRYISAPLPAWGSFFKGTSVRLQVVKPISILKSTVLWEDCSSFPLSSWTNLWWRVFSFLWMTCSSEVKTHDAAAFSPGVTFSVSLELFTARSWPVFALVDLHISC